MKQFCYIINAMQVWFNG